MGYKSAAVPLRLKDSKTNGKYRLAGDLGVAKGFQYHFYAIHAQGLERWDPQDLNALALEPSFNPIQKIRRITSPINSNTTNEPTYVSRIFKLFPNSAKRSAFSDIVWTDNYKNVIFRGVYDSAIVKNYFFN